MPTETTLMAAPGVVRASPIARFGSSRLLLGSTAVALLGAGLASQWSWLVRSARPRCC